MKKIKEFIKGFFSCTNLIKHCLLPKEVKESLESSQERYDRIEDQLKHITAEREEIERRYKAIEDKLTIDGDPDWFRASRKENQHV